MQNVLTKLKFRDTGIVLNAPSAIEEAFVILGCLTSLRKTGTSSNVLVFVNDKKELLDFLNKQLKRIEPDSVFWFAYPKGSSKVKTDINRDSIMATGEEFGITTVTAISINEIWSGLRFRPMERVGK